MKEEIKITENSTANFIINSAIRPTNTVFYQHDQNNMPILELREDGDILVKGKLITNDMQVVDAFREFLIGRGFSFNNKQDKDNWVSVEDDLPKEDGCYFIFDGLEVLKAGWINDKWFLSERGFCWTEFTTHWMPLPQPPKQSKTK
jgi:hypothetical protein